MTCCSADLKTRHWQLGQQVGGADALAVQAELDAIFAQRTLAQWTEAFAGSDCCVSPILRTSEALAHPLFQARGMAARALHESEGEYWSAAGPLKFKA